VEGWRSQEAEYRRGEGGKGSQGGMLVQGKKCPQKEGVSFVWRPDTHRYFTTYFLIPVCGHSLPGTSIRVKSYSAATFPAPSSSTSTGPYGTCPL